MGLWGGSDEEWGAEMKLETVSFRTSDLMAFLCVSECMHVCVT